MTTTTIRAVTGELASFAAALRYPDVPDAVSREASLRVLDVNGIALRALRDSDSDPAIRSVLGAMRGTGGATALGEPEPWSPAHAAFLNATLAHTLDFDDTHEPGSVHPGAVVIPTVLALAEEHGTAGRDALAAIVAGYEVVCRVAMALGPASLYARGFHPTPVAGIVGATAAAGNVLQLTSEQIESALGIAISHAAGSMQFLENGAWTKRLHAGQAAHDAILAAQLAAAGFRGAALGIEGRYGLLRAYSDEPNVEAAVAGLGDTWELLRASIKPYPACRYAHGPLDAIAELVRLHRVTPDDVEGIQIGLSATAVALIGEPAAEKRRPQNIADGQFSMHFLAAAAVQDGGFGWDDYTLLGDPTIESLMDRVTVVEDPEASAAYPERWLSYVSIRTGRGELRLDQVGAHGGEGDPLTPTEVCAKFDALVEPVLASDDAEWLRNACLDSAPDLGAIGAFLRQLPSSTKG